jgi:hypothetical protein
MYERKTFKTRRRKITICYIVKPFLFMKTLYNVIKNDENKKIVSLEDHFLKS